MCLKLVLFKGDILSPKRDDGVAAVAGRAWAVLKPGSVSPSNRARLGKKHLIDFFFPSFLKIAQRFVTGKRQIVKQHSQKSD